MFTVYNASGSAVGTLTTDANGNTGTIELPEGTYTVKETTPPKGYYKAADKTVTVTGGQTATLKVSDNPASDPLVMVVGKYDGDKTYTELEGNMPQGSASLAGAEFTVEYYDTLDYDSYDDLKDADVKPTRTWVFETDSDGFAYFGEDNLVSGDEFYYDTTKSPTIPRGTVVVYESKAPTGYKLNDDVSFQKIQDSVLDGVVTYNMPEVPDSIVRGGVSVQKLDAQTGETPQGDASFEGIEFSIINDNENDVIVDGKSYAPGAVVMTITTDEDGFASTADDALPYGDYIIRETGTNDGYLNTSEDMHATVSEDGKVYSFTASDDVVRGGVKVTKRDLETGQFSALGAASLEGTTFEVLSLNDNPVTVEGVRYSKGDSVATLTIHDGEAATASDLLPYGTYALHEVKAGEGYRLTDDIEFSIRKDGEIVSPGTGGIVYDQVKRGDLEFTKKAEDTGNRLAGVAFKMTSQTTGESHVIVTDENGYFSSASSWNKHTDDTNGNDWALTEDGTIDSSKLDSTSGLWFGGTDPDDSNGALPYDTYTIEELRCTANEGYQLIETSIIVSRDAQVYDFGTLDDIKASIVTNAYDPDDSDSYIGVGEVKVADKVTYSNLVAGRDYTLVAELHDASTGDALRGADGKAVTVEKTFTASESSGSEVVELSLSTFDLGGKTITVYEKLYDHGGSLIAEHADKDDVSQQVTVIEPEIGTTAVDGADGDKTVSTDDAATVVDTVSYRNLIPGKEYTVKGTLHVKKTDKDGTVTEEALEVDGKAVTAETTFVPETADGTVDVTFTFDSLSLKDGTQLVAFESLEHAGHELAVHADIEDVGQTVTVKNPTIATTALDGVDNDKNVVTDDETIIVDTVEYHNLVPGKEYVLNGTLHVKDTGDALEVDGKAVTAQTAFTPEASDGTVNVTFTFDSRSVSNKTELVVFESLARDGKELANHEDIEDVNQMVVVTTPSIGTTALDGVDGDKNVVTDDETTIVDTVAYQNLIPGKTYTLKGTLHVKGTDDDGNATDEVLLDAGGNPVTAETTFVPETADGTVDVTFTFDARHIEDGTKVVAFESLEKSGVEIAAHADIEDDDQTTTARVTSIGTTATDGLDGDKTVIADAQTTVTDSVEYENALTGTPYTMAGILMDADTGLPILTGDGSEKYTDADVADFMAQLLDVLGLSAENEEGYAEVPVSDETDGDAVKAQSVRVYTDGTYEVIDSVTGTDEDGLGFATVDSSGKVAYDDLTDEQKEAVSDVAVIEGAGVILDYSGTGELPADFDADALAQLFADNADLVSHMVYQTAEFTPEKDDGTVSMDFGFNANDVIDRLSGETKDIVVFEVMFKGSLGDEDGGNLTIVASECDLDSEEQTVVLTPSTIGTTAVDKSDGDHELLAGQDAVITDTVEYEGLIPGKEYTLKATLMDKETGEPLSVNDQHVTAELKFTPNSQSGSVDIDLGKFDASDLDGHDLVVFEELYKQTTDDEGTSTDVLVAEHKDIEDEGQTVTVTTTPPGGFFGKTGGNTYFIVLAIAALVVLAGGCTVYAVKNRRSAKGGSADDAPAEADGNETDGTDGSENSEA